jgi:hypothetical protein
MKSTKEKTKNPFEKTTESAKAWDEGYEAESSTMNSYNPNHQKLWDAFEAGHRSKNDDISVIPEGLYCYRNNKTCPYWYKDPAKPYQMNGGCSFMGKTDEDEAAGLLWDQVKECGIKTED